MPVILQQQNLKVSYAFIEAVQSNNRFIVGHIYQFTSATGIQDYFTDLDLDIKYNNVVWKSGSLRIDGLRRKVSIGLSVDEQDIKIWANSTDTLFGSNFLTGAEQGLLDGAIIQRSRVVWQFVTGNAAQDVLLQPVVVFPLFTGYTAEITKGGPTHVELTVRSAISKLEVNMPRNYYQPGCLWTLFDSGCTLSKSSYLVYGTVGTGPTGLVIPVSGSIATPIGADGIAEYAQGRLLFSSGANSGLQVLIDTNDGSRLYLAYVLDQIPASGDTFTYTPGCSKSFSTCQLKFANTENFRGFDKVPPVMLSM